VLFNKIKHDRARLQSFFLDMEEMQEAVVLEELDQLNLLEEVPSPSKRDCVQ